LGDEKANIKPHTPFEDLPDDYQCNVCEGSKELFKKAVVKLAST
jgi:rubredoxin